MSGAEVGLIVVAVVAVILFALTSVARRLDRLHRREGASRATLEAQLVRRAEAAMALTECDLLDPAARIVVAEAAWRAAAGAPRLIGDDTPGAAEERGLAESELTRVLRAALGDGQDQRPWAEREDSAALLEHLGTAGYRAQLARRFHNDAVVQIRRIRRTPLVRIFRLAGRAPLPETFEMDDDLPVPASASPTVPDSGPPPELR
ncbi:hypothetical protein [Ruania zhangjianzhongii]|uniref:hypothetical protein n=1 Tax=Ruania zhangjianzhongii TaxID=2603206 RepID=UPI0011C8CDD2|nr:hypothetical protein [Ruania zhangjianzhongii]